MSLVGTLAKVAIGVAVFKAGKSILGKQRDGQVGDGGLFGGRHSPGADQGGTGLEDVMGDIFGGKSAGGSSSSGGLGGVLEDLQRRNPKTADGGLDDLFGGGRQAGGAGGAGDLIGGLIKELAGGRTGGGAAGGLGGLLGGLAEAAAGGATKRGGSFGDILNQSMQRRGEPEVPPTPDQEAVAGLMLRAMIQAAKSDGNFDEGEQKKLFDKLGDVSSDERAFVMEEMQRPVDARALARQVPPGLEQQVYAMSLLGINLDNQNEAKYLHDLASAMNIERAEVNHIHAQIGAPSLYT